MKLTKELLIAIQNDNPAILHLLEEAETIIKEALDAKRANLKNAIYAYIGKHDEKLAEEVLSLLDAQITPSVNSTEEKCKCEGKCSHEKQPKPKAVNLSANEADAVLKQFLTLFQ